MTAQGGSRSYPEIAVVMDTPAALHAPSGMAGSPVSATCATVLEREMGRSASTCTEPDDLAQGRTEGHPPASMAYATRPAMAARAGHQAGRHRLRRQRIVRCVARAAAVPPRSSGDVERDGTPAGAAANDDRARQCDLGKPRIDGSRRPRTRCRPCSSGPSPQPIARYPTTPTSRALQPGAVAILGRGTSLVDPMRRIEHRCSSGLRDPPIAWKRFLRGPLNFDFVALPVTS